MVAAFSRILALLLAATVAAGSDVDEHPLKKHHGHHGHHHHRHHHHHGHHRKEAEEAQPVAAAAPRASAPQVLPAIAVAKVQVTGQDILAKMRHLEGELDSKEKKMEPKEEAKEVSKEEAKEEAKEDVKEKKPACERKEGTLIVNGPLGKDFENKFTEAVYQATGCKEAKVEKTEKDEDNEGLWKLEFSAPKNITTMVEEQAADPKSLLAQGALRNYLIEDGKVEEEAEAAKEEKEEKKPPPASEGQPAMTTPGPHLMEDEEPAPKVEHEEEEKEVHQPIDTDLDMPYGDLEPFGREDTAQELTEASIKESDAMVDQLERAEVAEEKRAVFRALTRLRGAAITSFDGVARSQTGNIDEYNKVNKWRNMHPIHHLANEESDVNRWAFPSNADF